MNGSSSEAKIDDMLMVKLAAVKNLCPESEIVFSDAKLAKGLTL